MKKIYCALFILFAIASVQAFSQSNNSWKEWHWLIGEWDGVGGGEPGSGGGSFTFRPDLGDKILLRKNHSSYPATKDRPAFDHEDLMIIYPGSNSSRAIYFDSEGHVINYTITFDEGKITFISDMVQNTPVFKLTYSLLAAQAVSIKFEISPNGEKFKTYLEGQAKTHH